MPNGWWRNSLADGDGSNPANYNAQENGGGAALTVIDYTTVLLFSSTACSDNATLSSSISTSHIYFAAAQTGGTGDYPGTLDMNDWNITCYGSVIDSSSSTILNGSGKLKMSSNTTSYFTISGTFTKETGTVEFASNGYLYVTGNSTSLNNVILNYYALSLQLEDTVTVTGTMTMTAFYRIAKGAGTGVWELKGNVTGANWTSVVGAMTGIFRLSGSTDQTISASGGTIALPKVEIASTGGTVYITDAIKVFGGWLYTSGAVDTGTSTYLHGASYDFHDDVTTWYKFTCDHNSGAAYGSSTIIVNNTFTAAAGCGAINTGAFQLKGDISILSTTAHGSATWTINGNVPQSMSAGGGSGSLCAVTVNTTSTLSLSDTFLCIYGWTWTAGTLAAGTSTFRISNVTVNNGTQHFNNVDFYRPAGGGAATITGTLYADGNVTHTDIGVVNGGLISLAGNLSSTVATMSGTCAYTMTGSGKTITGSSKQFPDGTITIDSAGTISLATAIDFSGTGQDVVIANGTLDTNGFALTVADRLQTDATGLLRMKGNEVITYVNLTEGPVEYYDAATPAVLSNYGSKFTDFTVPTGAKSFTWSTVPTYTVTGTWTWNGTSAARAVFVSSTPGTHWKLNFTGTLAGNVDSIDVTDSDASYGNQVPAIGSIGSNTHNWKFANETATGQASAPGVKADGAANAEAAGDSKTPGIKADAAAALLATGAAKVPGVNADAAANTESIGSVKAPGVKGDAAANTYASASAKVPGVKGDVDASAIAVGSSKVPGVKADAASNAGAVGAAKAAGIKADSAANTEATGDPKAPGVKADASGALLGSGDASISGVKSDGAANAEATGDTKTPGVKADGFVEYVGTGSAKVPGVKADSSAESTTEGAAKTPGVKGDVAANATATGAAKIGSLEPWGSAYTQAWVEIDMPGVKGAATANTNASGASKAPGVKSSGVVEAQVVGAVKVPGVSANGQAAATATGVTKVPAVKASGAGNTTAAGAVKVPGVRGHAISNAEGTGSVKVPAVKAAGVMVVTATGVVKVPGIRGHGLGNTLGTGSAKSPSPRSSGAAHATVSSAVKVPGVRADVTAIATATGSPKAPAPKADAIAMWLAVGVVKVPGIRAGVFSESDEGIHDPTVMEPFSGVFRSVSEYPPF